jgi:translation initiation factor IF-2
MELLNLAFGAGALALTFAIVTTRRVLREDAMIFEGKLATLKRFKDDAREVPAGLECGISVANFNDVRVGDLFEFYTKEEIPV